MIYQLSLKTVGLVVGLGLIAAHVYALVAPEKIKPLLRTFPRSSVAGTILLAAAGIWTFWLVATMDLGEFARMRNMLMMGVVAGTILTWKFVPEFLAVRSLGILALLAAAPLIEAAFLKEPTSRLLLVALAYAWIFAGLFLVGMPYLLRDFLAWLLHKPGRYRVAAIIAIAYGALITLCALLFW